MKFHSTDESCRFRSFAEAERYADKWWEQAEQRRAAAGSYSPPRDKIRIKRMCLGCRRREVHGRARYCDNRKCIRARKSKNGLFAPSESTTYGGSKRRSATTIPRSSNVGVKCLSMTRSRRFSNKIGSNSDSQLDELAAAA